MRFRGHGFRYSLLTLLLAAFGCGVDDAGSDAASLDGLRAEGTRACMDFSENGLAFGARTRATLRVELGAPTELHASEVTNYGGVRDSTFRMHYEGLVISLHKPAGGSEMVDAVRVLDGRYLRYPDLGPGSSAEAVLQRLGAPAQHEPNALVYICHAAPARDDPVTFRLANDTVAEVIFTYFMD
jgi:hypothetical protein